VTDGRNCYS